jgi:hypothetical protein
MLSSSAITYSLIGSVLFAILGVLATYYRDDKPSGKSIGRDFVAGAIIVMFLNVLTPGLFPDVSFSIPGMPSFDDVMSRRGGGSGDYELQL